MDIITSIYKFIFEHWKILFGGIGVPAIGIAITIKFQLFRFLFKFFRIKKTIQHIEQNWYGEIRQLLPDDILNNMTLEGEELCISTCKLKFSCCRKLVGEIQVHYQDTKNDEKSAHTMFFKGQYKSHNIYIFEYQNKDTRILQYGTFTLKLSSDRKTLSGTFSGFGPVSEKPVKGEVFLKLQK